jgi:hypothetical protein
MDFELIRQLKADGFPLKFVNHTGPTVSDEGFVLMDRQWFIAPHLIEIQSWLELNKKRLTPPFY